ncbi:hypothetical protein SAMN06265348_103223 [Pedobacter westerhofensis]|uniref:P pilus assembly protein, chaperone PapD n=1 Tax=Pedobacter westerhofensis TaxID=425512 RepID=A0A521C4U2_9SPHI|nr:hypothetical protein [Pedobacter westerhofensis]SMO54527.1 hypothetical protein SAMN06265348_103223 [Pedobacter westerhofensis]
MKLLTVILTLSLVLSIASTSKGQGFSISPSRIFFTGNPGETIMQSVIFSNTSSNTLSFISRLQDWVRDSKGNKVYSEINTHPASNAKWISLSENNIVLLPGEKKQIIISLHIPADADKLTHSMLFFTQVKEQNREQAKKVAIGVTVLMEVGIQIYYTPRGLNPGEMEILAFEDRGIYNNGQKMARRIELQIHNKGAVNKDAFVRLELTNKETGEEIKIEPQTIAMLPEATQWVTIDLPPNLKGKFLAVAMLDAGSTYDLKIAEKEIIYRP